MPLSGYVRQLREKIGNELVFVPGVSAIIQNDAGEILLEKRGDNGQWDIPAGAMEPFEAPGDAIVREVLEETGLHVVPERMVGVFGGPEYFITYPNGDRSAYISIMFACRIVSGEAKVNDDESLEVRFFPPAQLPPLSTRTRQRIEQALRNEPPFFSWSGRGRA